MNYKVTNNQDVCNLSKAYYHYSQLLFIINLFFCYHSFLFITCNYAQDIHNVDPINFFALAHFRQHPLIELSIL